MKKIAVSVDPGFKALESRVEVVTKGGDVFGGFSDILREIPPLEEKRDRVKGKYFDLCEPALGKEKTREIAEEIQRLEEIGSMKTFGERL